MEGKQALTSLKMIKSVMLLNGEKNDQLYLGIIKECTQQTNSGRKQFEVDGMLTLRISWEFFFSVGK